MPGGSSPPTGVERPRHRLAALAFLLLWASAFFLPLAPAAPAGRAGHAGSRGSIAHGRSATPLRRPVASPLRPAHRATTQRYAIFILGSPAGSMTTTETPATYEGHEALRVDSDSDMKLVALGTIEQKIETRQFLDPAGRPLWMSMTMRSGGHTTKVEARFTASKVDCTVESGGTKTARTVDIPAGITLVADPEQVGPKGVSTKLKPGLKMQLHMFEPMTLQILPVDLEVLPSETVTVGGKSYKATVVKTTTPLTGDATSWLDEAGDMLQLESALGIKMVRESAGAPPSPATAYVPPPDFAVATSIRTQTVIKDPRAVSLLRLRVQGIPDESMVLTDARQSADIAREAGKLTVTYTIRAAPAGGDDAPPPAPGDDTQGAAAAPEHPNTRTPEHLNSAPYLEVDDPRIQKQAREIVGDATDPLEKARRVRAWVHERMKPQMDIGVIRSATDVLQHPVGVCRDYAVLFTALARAAGVPARVCGGIVYFKDGFYYHAWGEVQPHPGAEWVAFDATLPTDFVDATHIKFAQGDPTAMFGAVRVVGKLKAEVLEYR
jgi:hypothetical protein